MVFESHRLYTALNRVATIAKGGGASKISWFAEKYSGGAKDGAEGQKITSSGRIVFFLVSLPILALDGHLFLSFDDRWSDVRPCNYST